MHQIRQALNDTSQVRVVRNQVGYDAEHRCRYGLGIGSPDLVGVLRGGLVFCLEVKTPIGRLTPEQQAWWRAARTWGVKGGVARSVDEAMALLNEVNRGDTP